MREHAGVEVGLLALTFGVAAAACHYWEPLAVWLTEEGTGEPVALLQSVSVWPTILLRALSIVLTLYLVWRAWRKLGASLIL